MANGVTIDQPSWQQGFEVVSAGCRPSARPMPMHFRIRPATSTASTTARSNRLRPRRRLKPRRRPMPQLPPQHRGHGGAAWSVNKTGRLSPAGTWPKARRRIQGVGACVATVIISGPCGHYSRVTSSLLFF